MLGAAILSPDSAAAASKPDPGPTTLIGDVQVQGSWDVTNTSQVTRRNVRTGNLVQGDLTTAIQRSIPSGQLVSSSCTIYAFSANPDVITSPRRASGYAEFSVSVGCSSQS